MRAILLFCFLPIIGFAQNTQFSLFNKIENKEVNIRFNTELDINTNTLDNSAIKKGIYGAYLSPEFIEFTAKKLNANNNRIGAVNEVGFTFQLPNTALFKKDNLSIQIQLFNSIQSNVKFSKNIFKLFFQGNSQFAGTTVNLGENQFNFLAYSGLGVGFYNRKTGSQFNINYVNGQQLALFNFEKTSLYTEQNGRELSLTSKGNILLSDTSKNHFGANNGNGASLNGQYNVKNLNETKQISIGYAHVGFIAWKNTSLEANFDTTINFDGVEVNSIFNSNTSEGDNIIDSIAPSFKNNSQLKPLPAYVWFNYESRIKNEEKLSYFVGINYRFFSQYRPQVKAGINIDATPWLIVGFNARAGGYGNLNLGFYTELLINNSFFIFMQSENLTGILLPEGNGAQFALGLSATF